ncbi:MAG: hypothetical protein AMXMBFR13_49510 [Phycisphaerae bacterium]
MDRHDNDYQNRRVTEPRDEADANRDPITGAPGSHPVGTGVGATAGGVAGAAIGAIGGPVGAVVGTAVGGVVGGLVGKGVGEGVNPTVEHEYWQTNYRSRPYADENLAYEEYGPAYQCGWEGYCRYPDRDFDDIEPDLRRDWEHHRGSSSLTWDRAKDAARDAWQRVRGGSTGKRHDSGY